MIAGKVLEKKLSCEAERQSTNIDENQSFMTRS